MCPPSPYILWLMLDFMFSTLSQSFCIYSCSPLFNRFFHMRETVPKEKSHNFLHCPTQQDLKESSLFTCQLRYWTFLPIQRCGRSVSKYRCSSIAQWVGSTSWWKLWIGRAWWRSLFSHYLPLTAATDFYLDHFLQTLWFFLHWPRHLKNVSLAYTPVSFFYPSHFWVFIWYLGLSNMKCSKLIIFCNVKQIRLWQSMTNDK